MRKVQAHSHYVTGVMSEDESGNAADNSMHPEVGAAVGGASVATIGGRHRTAAAPAPKAKRPSSDD
jgi:hypothetical protein